MEEGSRPIKDMTVDEFRALHATLTMLDKAGRDDLKFQREGEEIDFAKGKGEGIDLLTSLPKVSDNFLRPPRQGWKYLSRLSNASLLRFSSIFERWDRGNPRGFFTRFIGRPLGASSNAVDATMKRYRRYFEGLKDNTDYTEVIEDSPFKHPRTGEALPATRETLRRVLGYAGDAEGFEKLVRGWNQDSAGKKYMPDEQYEKVVMDWIFKNATPEDVKFVKNRATIKQRLFKEISNMQRGLTGGIAPDPVEPRPIEWPAGSKAFPNGGRTEGWYEHVDYDQRFIELAPKAARSDSLEDANFVSAISMPGSLRRRTAAFGPVNLFLDTDANQMRGLIRDLEMRPAVLQAHKLFRDPDFRGAVHDHFGIQYRDNLVPYLKELMGRGNTSIPMQQAGRMVSNFFLRNVTGALIGWNPGTVQKHFLSAAMNSIRRTGPASFAREAFNILSTSDDLSKNNWQFAWENSQAIQRRDRSWMETIGGDIEEAFGKRGKFETMRDAAMWLYAKPVAFSDMLSARVMWNAVFKDTLAKNEGNWDDAVSMADQAVEEEHGTTAGHARPPALWQQGAISPWFFQLYNFFGTMWNRTYGIGWRARDVVEGLKKGSFEELGDHWKYITFGTFSYLIWPAIVHEMVAPSIKDCDKNYFSCAAIALGKETASMLPGIRDVADLVLGGAHGEPQAGLLSTAIKHVWGTVKDLEASPRHWGKVDGAKMAEHVMESIGVLTGLVNDKIAKGTRFIVDFEKGKEHPKGMSQWYRGLRTGTVRGKAPHDLIERMLPGELGRQQ